MNEQMLQQSWDQMRQKYGVYLRLLDAIPEQQYFTLPVPGMRSAAELAVHTSGVLRDIAQGVAKGRITADESADAEVTRKLGSKAAVIDHARRCWAQASAAVATIGDAQLSATVETPWNMTFPGFVGMAILHDEFVHHRGQLYVYARLAGAEPPFLWGFGENAPEFRPAREAVAANG